MNVNVDRVHGYRLQVAGWELQEGVGVLEYWRVGGLEDRGWGLEDRGWGLERVRVGG